MSGRRPLNEDERARVALQARSGALAIEVSRDPGSRAAAVAELSLIAPCRPDLVGDMIARLERQALPADGRDWPPRAIVLELLIAAREVTAGAVGLVGPDRLRVEQVTATGFDRQVRRLLRVSRRRRWVADVATVAELAELVDPATLREDA